jgi:hypothetical protein
VVLLGTPCPSTKQSSGQQSLPPHKLLTLVLCLLSPAFPQATGLALPGSDLDVVLLGTPCPSTKNAADGFRMRDRITIRRMLVGFKKALVRSGLARDAQLEIIDARVPLCKGAVKFTLRQEEVLAALREDEAAAAGSGMPRQQQQQHGGMDVDEDPGFLRGGSSSNKHSSSSPTAAAAAGSSSVSALSAVVAMVKDAVRRSSMCPAAPGKQQQGGSSGSGVWRVELPVDLSLGVENGAAAVSFMTRQVRALPPLRPLVLVIKAMLKEAGLNEVFTGGLSSYSLVNMVVAHLQAESMQAAPVAHQPQRFGTGRRDSSSSSSSWSGSVISQEQVQQHLTQIAQSAAAAAAENGGGASAGSSSSSSSGGRWDLGCLLHGFFVRYGELFSYHNEAVSVAAGGIIAKHRSWYKPGGCCRERWM